MKTNNQALLASNLIISATNTSTRQIYALLTALFFIISMILVPSGTVSAAGNAVKWHPGHYYTIMSWGKNNSNYLSDVYSELKATPALRGIQIRYFWSELETAKGVYDFSSIDKRLKELSAIGKRLVIQVQTKSFAAATKPVPDYLLTAEYEGGIFAYADYGSTDPDGYNIKLWNPKVRDRLIALFAALGKRYNSQPYFEGIGMIETALGQSIEPLASTQQSGFFSNLAIVHEQMRLQFPNTMTIQEVNYPRPVIGSLVSKFQETGTSLSSPDTFLEEPGLLYEGTDPGIYHYYSELSGTLPMAPQVMQKNYRNTKGDGTGYQPTVSELLAFARDQLKANYIFWTRDKDYYPQVLEMLRWSEQAKTPSGGLNAICPTTYGSCVQ